MALRFMKQLFFSELHTLINNLASASIWNNEGCLFAALC
jgi:hypothetical protein